MSLTQTFLSVEIRNRIRKLFSILFLLAALEVWVLHPIAHAGEHSQHADCALCHVATSAETLESATEILTEPHVRVARASLPESETPPVRLFLTDEAPPRAPPISIS